MPKILDEILNGERTDVKEGQALAQISIDHKDLKRRVLLKLIPKSVYITFALEFDYSTFHFTEMNIHDFCDRWYCSEYENTVTITPSEVRSALAKLEKSQLIQQSDHVQLRLDF
jgi:hypothetical protein